MNNLLKHIKGDRTIWSIVAVLAIFSFMPVYSASTNLVYVVGSGSTFGYLIKHMILLIMGFVSLKGFVLPRLRILLKVMVSFLGASSPSASQPGGWVSCTEQT